MTASDAAVRTLRATLLETIRPLITGVDAYAMIDFPNYPNVGDSAIYLGQRECLRALGAPDPRFVCDFRTYDRATLARRIGATGTILLTGGGSFGDLWPTAQELREELLRAFPRNPVVQLPQTIHFEHAASRERARAAIATHERFTLLVRDRQSVEKAGVELGTRAVLCPDMAFALGPLTRPVPPRRPIVWLLRTDKESRAPEARAAARDGLVDWLDEPATLLRSMSYVLTDLVRRGGPGSMARPLLTAVYGPLARQRLHRGVAMLSAGHVVVTDRLHGHIISLLLGIPHVVLDNSYGKLSSFIATWTHDVDGVLRAESLAEAAALAQRLATSNRGERQPKCE
jgi:pyruvyl transferase EpsO